MGKAVGKFYIITRQCLYMIAQFRCMHQQQIFILLCSFGSHRPAGLSFLYMTERRFGQPVNIIHIALAGRFRKFLLLLTPVI